MLQEYAGHPQISGVKHEQNPGGAASCNRASSESSGDLIAALNSDDKYRSEYLGVQGEAFAADPGLGLNCAYVVGIDEQGEPLAETIVPRV